MPVDIGALKQRIDLLELIGRDTRLKRVASTRGGEHAGPCPFCGGRDRLRVQPARGRWWCRGCLGSARWQDAIAYVQRRDGLDDLVEACRRLGASPGEQGLPRSRRAAEHAAQATAATAACEPNPASQPVLPDDLAPPTAWQARGRAFLDECQQTLWSTVGERARTYLYTRGLRDQTLRLWQVGFQPHYGRYEPAADWGLGGDPVYVPRGIVPPWFADDRLGHLQVRTSPHDHQEHYLSVRGGHPWLFGADTLVPEAPAILLEGALDVLLVWQHAGDVLGTASLGSCRKLPSPRALGVLGQCRPLFEAYDADAEGEAGALRLRQVLPDLVRLCPTVGKDATAFRRRGGSVRAWLAGALSGAATAAGQNPPS